jgi:hypothetical protein
MSTRRSFRQAARSIERLAKEMDRRVPSGIRVIGEELETDANASRAGHGVPVDEGIMRSTARVQGPDNRGQVEWSYGGAAAPYTLRQHEDTSLRHTVGEARWMIRAIDRWKPDGSQGLRALRENAEAGIRAARAAGKIE